MEQHQHPTKDQVRESLKQPQAAYSPPSNIEEIRRQLGWDLFEAQRQLLTR